MGENAWKRSLFLLMTQITSQFPSCDDHMTTIRGMCLENFPWASVDWSILKLFSKCLMVGFWSHLAAHPIIMSLFLLVHLCPYICYLVPLPFTCALIIRDQPVVLWVSSCQEGPKFSEPYHGFQLYQCSWDRISNHHNIEDAIVLWFRVQ